MALEAYLRAERGLLVEVAPHEVTVLPGGDLTPRGARQGLEGAQIYRHLHATQGRTLRSHPRSLAQSHSLLLELGYGRS